MTKCLDGLINDDPIISQEAQMVGTALAIGISSIYCFKDNFVYAGECILSFFEDETSHY